MQKIKLISSPTANSQQLETQKTKIKLIASNIIHVIQKADILYLKADSNYCDVVLANGERFCCSQTLKQLESRLNSVRFYRPHQSYLFNVTYLKSVAAKMSHLTLEGDVEIPVSRRNRHSLRSMLDIWFD